MSVAVSAFYKFVRIGDCESLAPALRRIGKDEGLRGTILVAPEGLNATIAGSAAGVGRFLAALRSDPRFSELATKDSTAEVQPFQHWKVKIKPEILTFGAPEADPSVRTGAAVKPRDWNALIARDDVLLIDTRNAYEVAIGTFRGALDPHIRAFTGFKDFVRATLDPERHKKIAMFCTGGIRCEKASAYLLAHGFAEVYQLEGGILKYLEEVAPEESQWDGACFVFDERVSVVHGVTPGGHRLCRCGWPIGAADESCPSCGAGINRGAGPGTAV